MTNASTENNLPEITLDRVVEAMRSFDIELTKMDSDIEAATANLNGLPTMFAVLDSVVIVRCDVPTDAAYSKADAGLFLAANRSTPSPSVRVQLSRSTMTCSWCAPSAISLPLPA